MPSGCSECPKCHQQTLQPYPSRGRAYCLRVVDCGYAENLAPDKDDQIAVLVEALEELGKRLRWLSTYEKAPPEVTKDEFAYDRLLAWVKEQAADWAAKFVDTALAGEKEDTMPSEDIIEDGWLKGLPFNVLVSVWVKAQPEMMAGIREGVAAAKAGKVTPWEEVERELGLGGDAP